MGFVDRGGGREAKGSSLRRSKKNPGAPSTRNKSSTKNYVTPATRTVPTPPAALLPMLTHMVAELTEGAAAGDASAMPRDAASQQALIASVRSLMGTCYPEVKTEAGDVAAEALDRLNVGVDAAVALLSRKLEVDVEGIFRRAVEEGHLSAMLCWCNELERQPLLMETCRNHNNLALKRKQGSAAGGGAGEAGHAEKKRVRFADDEEADGAESSRPRAHNSAVAASIIGGDPHATRPSDVVLYCLVGVHVNNIDRTSRKVQEQWIEDIGKQAKSPEVLGILSGLNLARESGTHYAQEWMLRECWRVAAELRLPLVLHVYTPNKKKEDGAATPAPAAGEEATALPKDTAAAAAAQGLADDVMVRTANRAAEILVELLQSTETAAPVAVVLYNGLKVLAASSAMRELVRTHRPPVKVRGLFGADEGLAERRPVTPFYVMVTAEGLCEAPPDAPKNLDASAQLGSAAPSPAVAPAATAEADLTPFLPLLSDEEDGNHGGSAMALSQLLIGTGAPWGTPQNLPDEHLRTLPNEPGNYTHVVKAVHDAILSRCDAQFTAVPSSALTEADVAGLALRNFAWAFFSDYVHERAVKGDAVGPAGNEEEDGDGTEAPRFASSSAGGAAAHVDPSAVPTAYVCVKCRAPLFYPSAITHHTKGAGAADAAGGAAASSGKKGKKGKGGGGKRGKGRRDDDSDDDAEHAPVASAGAAEGNATCPSPSALFLQATLAQAGSAVEALLDAHGPVGMDLVLEHVNGVKGQHHADCFAMSAPSFPASGHKGKGKGKANALAAEPAVVACAACEAKLGEAQVNGPCYDCGAVLHGVTLRLRPRAVEECPVLDGAADSAGRPAASKGNKAPASKKRNSQHETTKKEKRDEDANESDSQSDSTSDDGRADKKDSDNDNDNDGGSQEDESLKEAPTELDLILAAAARERELLEKERQEAEEAGYKDPDAANSKRKKEKKKNVKANNRSNFTHFRNKDFAPRLAKEKKLNHQRELEGFADGSHSDDSGEEDKEGEDTASQEGSDVAHAVSGSGLADRTVVKTGGHHKEASDDEESEEEQTTTMLQNTAAAASRRQRKKANKKRQQLQQQPYRGEDSENDDSDDSD